MFWQCTASISNDMQPPLVALAEDSYYTPLAFVVAHGSVNNEGIRVVLAQVIDHRFGIDGRAKLVKGTLG